MRLGVDIDGVLADSLAMWVRELNYFFKKNKRVEDIYLYDICRTFDINLVDLDRFMQKRGRFLMSEPPPMQGAAYFLKRIKHYHEIYIVSARDNQYAKETVGWLQKHGLPYDRLLLLGSHEKQAACIEHRLDALVEDTLEIGIKVSSAGVPVLLYDAPYNRGELPGLVFRRHSWEEIYRTVVADSQQLFRLANQVNITGLAKP